MLQNLHLPLACPFGPRHVPRGFNGCLHSEEEEVNDTADSLAADCVPVLLLGIPPSLFLFVFAPPRVVLPLDVAAVSMVISTTLVGQCAGSFLVDNRISAPLVVKDHELISLSNHTL